MSEANPYQDDYDQASEYLRLTLPLLAKCRIPPSPLNFRMGYEHVAGRNPEFRKALEQVIQEPSKADDFKLWNLYRQYFVQDEAGLEIIRKELQTVIATVRNEFEKNGGNLSEYSDTLQNFASVLEESSPDEIAVELQKVVDGTRKMESCHSGMQTQMTEMAAEVEHLRKEIEQVREEAMTDALTGISNRKAFDTEMENSIVTAAANDSTFSLIMGDVDHFKKFNDTHGHLVGDRVLHFVATVLKRAVKGSDMAARYGGEEFAVILPNTDETGAKTVAEQIRVAISSGKLRDSAKGNIYGKITISLGVSSFRIDDTPGAMIKRADEALYMAKGNGRNRVEVFTEE